MGLRLQKHCGATRDILPGQWCLDKPCIFIACPSCGGIDDVSVTQPPDRRSGLLPGRWKCPTATCGWADFVTLDCWNEEPHR